MMQTANEYGLWEDEFTKATFPKIQIIIAELMATRRKCLHGFHSCQS